MCEDRNVRASLFLGYMRQLKPGQKAQVRKIKEANGVRAAIARAKTIATKKKGDEDLG